MKSRVLSTVFALALVLVMGASASAFFSFGKYTAVEAENGVVSIPLADVSDGEAHYFSYDADGRTVKFFVVRSVDAVVRAAFDACDVCYKAKKGYVQEGDYMVCVNCNQRFHSARINEAKGGCNPAPLKRTVQGDNLVIAAEDIKKGAFYF